MKYSFKSFYYATVADWHRCEIPETSPDFISYSGSAYWDLGDRVRRFSDHWGRVSTCKWLLEGKQRTALLCGECYYDDFRNIVSAFSSKLDIEDVS